MQRWTRDASRNTLTLDVSAYTLMVQRERDGWSWTLMNGTHIMAHSAFGKSFGLRRALTSERGAKRGAKRALKNHLERQIKEAKAALVVLEGLPRWLQPKQK